MRQYNFFLPRMLILVFLIQITNHHVRRIGISHGIHNEFNPKMSNHDFLSKKMENKQKPLQNHKREVKAVKRSISEAPIRNDIQETDPKGEDGSAHIANDCLFQELFNKGRILAQEETVKIDKNGNNKRITILATEFKFPYLRVEETFVKGNNKGNDIILTRKAMVADHILVKINPGYGQEQLEQLNQRYNAEIINRLDSSQIYLVRFSDHTIDTITNAIESYRLEQSLITYAEPDYIVQILDIPNDPKFQDQWNLSLEEPFKNEQIPILVHSNRGMWKPEVPMLSWL